MAETETAAPDPNAITTHESATGRTLSGMGVTSEALADVMERHEPEPADAPLTDNTSDAAVTQPKQSRGQARFAELTKARKEAEAKAASYERELAELRAKVQPPTAPTPPATAPVAAAAPAPPSPSGPERGDSGLPSGSRPQPTEDEIGTKYKTYAEFVLDSARWVAEEQQSGIDARIRQSIEADRVSRDFLNHAESTWAKGRKVYADFDAMRTTGPGSQVPMDHAKIQAILQHPQSEHVQYAIVKDGALAQRKRIRLSLGCCSPRWPRRTAPHSWPRRRPPERSRRLPQFSQWGPVAQRRHPRLPKLPTRAITPPTKRGGRPNGKRVDKSRAARWRIRSSPTIS
jgi:hypothetical protein